MAGKHLVIVESPTKARTIEKYLGPGFQVVASVGHVKDLPKSRLGVDIDHGFAPVYEIIRGKKKILSEIKRDAKRADIVYLAPDPDREGEAIAWHIAEEIRDANDKIYRVIFNEITKKAVQEAIAKPHKLDKNKFDSQQARRILDRLVGYQISPILWNKVRRGLSAGRVQSVAVRLVVQREREVEKFVPTEYWSLEAKLQGALPPAFVARCIEIDGARFDVGDGATAKGLQERLAKASYAVRSVTRRERKRRPPAPFITSKLQQEAGNRLRFSPKKTMRIAQQLYEGVEVGEEGQIGLITYMRTDSTRLSDDAVTAARAYITETWGADHLPETPNVYKSKKSAQDAHEAIRPTSLEYPPSKVRKYLQRDQLRLYELIWQRFLACQMSPARYDQTTVDIGADGCTFRVTGSILRFPGYLAAYGGQKAESERAEEERAEGVEGAADSEGAEGRELPDLQEGDQLKLLELQPDQHFTQPPPRFTEASLVKELEDRGIGRPSTYATILSTIQDKEYVEKRENRFYPTELGTLVTDLLIGAFPNIMDVAFTAEMENQLDDVESGGADWVQLLRGFYGPFKESVAQAEVEMRNVKREEIPTEHICEKCGKPMVIKWGRNGSFLACSGYPDCKNTKEFKKTKDGKVEIQEAETTGEICDKCGKSMVMKRGKFGRFLACSGYPDCKNSKPVGLGVPCPRPDCGGELSEKRSRRGKVFYGCNRYPTCDFASWDLPINEHCPACESPYLVRHVTKREGVTIRCPNRYCGYSREETPAVDGGDSQGETAAPEDI